MDTPEGINTSSLNSPSSDNSAPDENKQSETTLVPASSEESENQSSAGSDEDKNNNGSGNPVDEEQFTPEDVKRAEKRIHTAIEIGQLAVEKSTQSGGHESDNPDDVDAKPVEKITPSDKETDSDTEPEGPTAATGVSSQPQSKWSVKINRVKDALMSTYVFMLCLAVVIGAVTGFGAHIFNRLISIVSNIFMRHIDPHTLNWWLIPVPVVGILIVGIYTRYIIRTNLTHGVSQLINDLSQQNYKLRRNIIYSPIIGGAITLGFGGSAGSEGPIAYSGAAIGSNIGRFLGLRPMLMKTMIGCGAASGISGIFMSPIGGLLFAIEFLKMELDTLSIIAVTLACFIAYAIGFICNGCIPSHAYTPDVSLLPSDYWSVILLGIFCGLYSLYYSSAINRTDSFFIKIKNPWIRNITGGLVVGVCIFLFPSLYGIGYPVLSDAIHSHFDSITEGNILGNMHIGAWGMMLVAVCILLLKCWACGSCNACGGVSSDFAPTMFAGGIAGFLFATFSNHVLGCHFSIGLFTFLGMAGVMAGAIEAPLMTIFIVLNEGTSFDFALAVGISALFSYMTVRFFSNLRGYDSMMVRHLHFFHFFKRKAS